MAITRWDPYAEMMSLRQAMDRLFQDAWVRPGFGGTQGATTGTVPLDIYETNDELVVTATLPGLKPEEIDITIQCDVLRIQGETRHDENVKEEQFHRRERGERRFYREVALPVSVKSDAVQAQFEHGILTLHLPKSEEAKPRRIQVQGGSTPQLESRAA